MPQPWKLQVNNIVFLHACYVFIDCNFIMQHGVITLYMWKQLITTYIITYTYVLCISTVTCTSDRVFWPEGKLSTINHLIIKRQWKRWLDPRYDIFYHHFNKAMGYFTTMNSFLVCTDLTKTNRLLAVFRQQNQFSFNTSSAFSCSWHGCGNVFNPACYCNRSSIITNRIDVC